MSFEGSLSGRYQLLRQLGNGDTDALYLASDSQIARQVVVKIIYTAENIAQNASALQQLILYFPREMRAQAELDHPHILPILDFGQEQIQGKTCFDLVQPYQPEGSLIYWLQRRNSPDLLPLSTVSALITQVAEALSFAHEREIVHQNIKPSNLLIRTGSGQDDSQP